MRDIRQTDRWTSGVWVNFFTYLYRADKKNHFWYEGPPGPNYKFWKGSHIEIFIGRPYKTKQQNGCLFRQKSSYLASILLRKTWLGSKLGDSGSRSLELMQGLQIQDG